MKCRDRKSGHSRSLPRISRINATAEGRVCDDVKAERCGCVRDVVSAMCHGGRGSERVCVSARRAVVATGMRIWPRCGMAVASTVG